MSRRSKFVLMLTLIAVFSASAAVKFVASRRLPPEKFNQEGLQSVDFTKLKPAVKDFIELAQQHQTIGKPTSSFPDLWSHALPLSPQDTGDRFRKYKFILPMTAALRAENDAEIVHKIHVLYLPMLQVTVNTDQSKIVGVWLYLQGI